MDSENEYALCPFTVVVDTREQSPFQFRSLKADADRGRRPLVVPVKFRGLPTGDYSIDGFEHRIAVERKSLPDLFHCCGVDRDRFVKQIERLNRMEAGYLVVEGGWISVLSGTPHSRLNAKTVYRSILAWQCRYRNVHWWLCPTRRFAETTCFRILERFWKDYSEKD